jgi:Flp pilus assembly protein TadD
MEAFRSGNYQAAADAFHDAITTDDQDHKAWNALGVVYTKTGEYEAADTW